MYLIVILNPKKTKAFAEERDEIQYMTTAAWVTVTPIARAPASLLKTGKHEHVRRN
jgi:hypothetical protein